MKRLPALFLLLVANSAYLAAWAEASLLYFANVALHLVLGVAVAFLAAREFPGWRRWPRTLALAAPVLAIAAVHRSSLTSKLSDNSWARSRSSNEFATNVCETFMLMR